MFIYHPRYLFGSRWLNALHPFEFDRARQASQALTQVFGNRFTERLISPERPLELSDFALVHDPSYLQSLSSGRTVTSVVEVPILGFFPYSWIRGWFLEPTLWGAAGTVLAFEHALTHGVAFNLSGGFHHAKRGGGEGFCLLSDIALGLERLRLKGLLTPEDPVFYIDLDVHQGNGISTDYAHDKSVRILDVYNQEIYPVDTDPQALEGVDVACPVKPACTDKDYLEAVESGLEELFDWPKSPRLVIYNAGTDIFQDDRLGGLMVTRTGVNRRDLLVLEAAQSRSVPIAILASGGYSKTSANLMADLGRQLMKLFA